MRTTHTYVILDVPAEFYRYAREKLLEAGYGHAVHARGDGENGETLDMHGVALRALPVTEPNASGGSLVAAIVKRLAEMAGEPVQPGGGVACHFCEKADHVTRLARRRRGGEE